MNDYTFTLAELSSEGILTVPVTTVGSFAIEDGTGQLVLTPQRKTESGIEVDLSDFNVVGVWKVRFFRGEAGKNTFGGISSTEAMIYALVFG